VDADFHSSRGTTVGDFLFSGEERWRFCERRVSADMTDSELKVDCVPRHFVHCGFCNFSVHEAQGGGDVEGFATIFF